MMSINESEFALENGKMGKIAVFIYTGSGDPRDHLNSAVAKYADNHKCCELMDSELNNPWMRVVISNINDMHQEKFDAEKHRLIDHSMIRDNKINNIINEI